MKSFSALCVWGLLKLCLKFSTGRTAPNASNAQMGFGKNHCWKREKGKKQGIPRKPKSIPEESSFVEPPLEENTLSEKERRERNERLKTIFKRKTKGNRKQGTPQKTFVFFGPTTSSPSKTITTTKSCSNSLLDKMD